MPASEYLHKSHNVSVLMYHIVCPIKYRKAVLNQEVEKQLRLCCEMIEERYEVTFLEIGVDKDHVHYLVQSVPAISPARLVQMIKSLTARWIFEQVPRIKKLLWGGALWTSGYFIATVGRHGSETAISKYVRNQGQGKVEYRVIHQKSLFGDDGA